MNPYAAPRALISDPPPAVLHDGHLWVGFALGFLLGLWGWIGCRIFAKQETKRGAGIGFLLRIGLTAVVVGAILLFDR